VSELDPYFLGYRREERERLERQANELAHESASLRSHLSEPGTLVVSSLFLQVWGRVPEGTA
jgi:hypothetical protein